MVAIGIVLIINSILVIKEATSITALSLKCKHNKLATTLRIIKMEELQRSFLVVLLLTVLKYTSYGLGTGNYQKLVNVLIYIVATVSILFELRSIRKRVIHTKSANALIKEPRRQFSRGERLLIRVHSTTYKPKGADTMEAILMAFMSIVLLYYYFTY